MRVKPKSTQYASAMPEIRTAHWMATSGPRAFESILISTCKPKILVQAKASFKPKWAYHISRYGAWDILKLGSDYPSVMRKMRPKRTPRPNPCAQFSTFTCKIYNQGPRTQTTRPKIIWGTDQEDAWRTAPIMAQTLPRTMQYRRPSTIPNIITVNEPTAAARV